MIRTASELNGYSISARDGPIGKVCDVLFDDDTWRVRWVVVETGDWLLSRRVLLPPSALGHGDTARHEFSVPLDRQQVKDSPDIDTDQSVSRHMETSIYDHYGWTPYWGTGFYVGGGGYIGGAMGAPYLLGRDRGVKNVKVDSQEAIHLRSVRAVTSYHIFSTDGEIGHLENFLVEDADWSVRYLVIATANWWPGKKVVISPMVVTDINWSDSLVEINVDRQTVKDSPAYDTPSTVDLAFTKRFNNYDADVIS